MAQLDVNKQGYPVGGYKRDWNLYTGGGLGGGATATATGTTRYTFWIDHSKFMTKLRTLTTQNVSFNIWKDAGLTQPAVVYVGVSQSDDITDEVIRAQGLTIDHATNPPPYFINTQFLTQPADSNYQNDQGRYVYDAYNGSGFGLGNNSKIVQEFVPRSGSITGVWLNRLFRSAGSLTDLGRFQDLTLEIWDTNKNVIGTGTISKYALTVDPSDSNVEFYTTISGTSYWTDYNQRRVRFNPAVRVNIGQTHYLCIKQSASTTTHDYAVGANNGSDGNYNKRGKYIFGTANTAPYASTVLTQIGTDLDICFVTQRNNGRTAITFLWDSSAYYWYDPATYDDQFRFVKEDSDRVI